eukprot:4596467-Amphidinium_carterae.1
MGKGCTRKKCGDEIVTRSDGVAAPYGSTTSTMSGEKPGTAVNLTRQVCLFVGVDYLGTSMIRSLLSSWAGKKSAVQLGTYEAMYGIGQVCGSVLLPCLSDSVGRCKILQLSCLGCVLGYALSSWAVASTALQADLALQLSRAAVGLTKQTLTMARAITGDVEDESDRQAGMAALTI